MDREMGDSRSTEWIFLPDGKKMMFKECLDCLLNTREICEFLDMLWALRERYLIILSVKDTPGGHMPNAVLRKLHEMGFRRLGKIFRQMYIGILDRGNVGFDKCGEKPEDNVEYTGSVCGVSVSVTSKSWNSGNRAEVKIENMDYSLNCRGLNFVVYDFELKEVIDSTTYDSFIPKPTFYHKNLQLSEEYIDTHFYLPEKYKKLWREPFEKKYFSNRSIGVKEIENVIIEPLKKVNGKVCGGVCDTEFKFITGHESYAYDAPKRNDRHICECYKVDRSELESSNETVVFGGIIFDHPGHLIVETLAERMWWILKNIDKNLKIAIVIGWGDRSAKFFKEFLEIFNFPEESVVIVRKATKFNRVIVPDQAEWVHLWTNPYELTKEFTSFYEFLRNAVVPSGYKKIYLTKSKTAKGNIVGEDYFIEFYRRHGFKIINPEDYTIREKVEFMLGADEVVSIAGTNTLYTIFCRPTVKLTILTRVLKEAFATQATAMEAAGINNFYIVNTTVGFFHEDFVYGLGFMCVTEEFRKYVKDAFSEELEVLPKESLKNNLYNYLKYVPEYYAEPRFFNTIKNQKMITILKNMSEVFLGKEFDTSRLNLSTTESDLSEKLKLTTMKLDFLNMLFYDILTQNRLIYYLLENKCSTVSLLCDDSYIAGLIKEILQLSGVKLLCNSPKSKCNDIPENEWELCKKSDIMLGYTSAGNPIGVRDNVSIVDIRDIITDKIHIKAGKESLVVQDVLYHVKTLVAVNDVKDKLGRQESMIAEQMVQLQSVLNKEEERASKVQVLVEAKEKLQDEKNNLEKQLLASRQEYEIKIKEFKQERMSAEHELDNKIKELERKLMQARQELKDGIRECEQEKHQERQEFEMRLKEITQERADIKEKLEHLQTDHEKITSDNIDLVQQVERFENSQSWRVTKPLRSLKWFFRRISGREQ